MKTQTDFATAFHATVAGDLSVIRAKRADILKQNPEWRKVCATGAWDNVPERLRDMAETVLADAVEPMTAQSYAQTVSRYRPVANDEAAERLADAKQTIAAAVSIDPGRTSAAGMALLFSAAAKAAAALPKLRSNAEIQRVKYRAWEKAVVIVDDHIKRRIFADA